MQKIRLEEQLNISHSQMYFTDFQCAISKFRCSQCRVRLVISNLSLKKGEQCEFVYCSREGQQISFINLPYESLAWEWGKTLVRWVYKRGHRQHCKEYLLLPQP